MHSFTLGAFIFFFTEAFYDCFFGVDVENFFFVKQAGLFLICLSLFYLVPLTDLNSHRRMIDLIIVTKILAVIFLVINTHRVPQPEVIILAAAGDAIMAVLLIYFRLDAGLFINKQRDPQDEQL